MRRSAIGIALALSVPLVVATAFAQSGATLTPDGLSFLVNKDVGNERWTIALNLSSLDPNAFNNVTGNVFKRDGSPPSFLLCQVRLDSPGDLENPASTFRLQCSGTDACDSTARQCARQNWVPLDGDIPIPADFFLPPGGLGDLGAVAAGQTRTARPLSAQAGATGGPAPSADDRRAVPMQSNDRGATLTLDGFNYLVNKDLGGLRWSISLNFVPRRTAAGSIQSRLQSVTGNVFDPSGNPSFIYCTPRSDSTGTLDDPSSNFRLSCVGTDACQGSASDCATTDWRGIPGGDDVQVPASFFLPPGGLPATVQSDPEIFVIGRTSDPPAIITGDFTVPGGGSATFATTAGGCPVGATCLARTLGTCSDVAGEVFFEDGFGCGCLVDPVPDACIGCGAGQCGGSCDFPVGGATARGTCLPISSTSDSCSCFAIGAGSNRPIDSCGGTLGVICASPLCCADDPTDGCDPARGDISCIGVCVDGGGCDPTIQICGSCLPPQIPGGGGTPTPRPTPTRTPGPLCGNDIAESGEECDGSDLRGRICADFDLSGGPLRCDGRCRFDLSGCQPIIGNTPPTITSISFPPTIVGDGSANQGTVFYRDPDLDVVLAEFDVLSGPPGSFSGEIAQGSNPDSFTFTIFCEASSQSFTGTWGVVLTDSRGNRSARATFSYTCLVPAGDNPPRITGISFPSVIQANSGNYSGTVFYTDPDLDVVFAEFTQVSGFFTPFSFEVAQSTNPDDFGFFINCTGSQSFSVTVGVFVTDDAGNRSPRFDFGFTCVP